MFFTNDPKTVFFEDFEPMPQLYAMVIGIGLTYMDQNCYYHLNCPRMIGIETQEKCIYKRIKYNIYLWFFLHYVLFENN